MNCVTSISSNVLFILSAFSISELCKLQLKLESAINVEEVSQKYPNCTRGVE